MAPVPSIPEAPTLVVVDDRWIRRSALVLLAALVVCLFLPWTTDSAAPTADIRPGLVWATVAIIVLGALALAIPSHWTAYVAALPATIPLTNIGPALWPTGGSYAAVVKLTIVLGALSGICWLVSAVLRAHATPSSTQWVIAPIGLLLALASIGLPWFVVSEIGVESGTSTAWELILGTPVGLPSGVSPTRITIMLALFIGVAAASIPLAVRHPAAWRVGVVGAFAAALCVVLTEIWVSVRLDAIDSTTGSPGQRICLAGLFMLGIVWSTPRQPDDTETDPIGLSPDPASNLIA